MLLHTENLSKQFVVASFVVLTICCLPVLVAAQAAPCKVTISSLPVAPELKGFQLGMTAEQAKAHAPQLVFGRTDELGVTKTTINPSFAPRPDKSNFQDVRTISLDFLDGRLVSLWIGYDPSFKWRTIEDFVSGISRSLALPNAWTEWKSRGKEITCADFQMTLSLIAQSPSFRIVDTAAAETIAQRRAAAAEEAESAAADEESDSEEILGDRETRTYYQGRCQPRSPIADENRVLFKTSAEAEKAGYKPSKTCS